MAVGIESILNKWAAIGVFDYLLPFLLIFAIVFGILRAMNVFRGNTSVDAIIALTVGFLSLQWGIVPQFFSTIFPYTGVGLAVILVVIIIAGFFIDPRKPFLNYILLGIGVVVTIFILVNTSQDLGWYSSSIIQDNLGIIIFAVVFLIILAAVIGSATPKKSDSTYGFGEWRGPHKP